MARNVNKEDFNKIKQLIDMGLTKGQVKKIVGRSYPTMLLVEKSKNWDSYQESRRIQSEKRRGIKKESAKPVTEIKDKALADQLNTIISLLRAIEYKLTPNTKRFFK